MTMGILQGQEGTRGRPGIVAPSVQDLNQLDSRSISPRVQRVDRDRMKEYCPPGELPVKRFLINNELEAVEAEHDVFKRAIDHLKEVPSAQTNLTAEPIPPRPIRVSNIVLVDIFDKKEGAHPEPPKFHTICLWKKTDTNLLMIDPSNYTFSERLLKGGLQSKFPSFSIDAKKHVGNVFYKSLQADKVDTRIASHEDDNNDYRDCIDIAVKIACSLNFSQYVAFDLFTIESRIDYLSNQRKVNADLLQGGAEAHIGWLQSSCSSRREEAVRLLFENKDYIAAVEGIENIQSLLKLNFMRLEVVKSSNDISQEDFLKLIKDTRSNSKLTLDQFSGCLKDWIDIHQKESEAKKSREKLKDQIREDIKLQKKGGTKK
ncbi:MAG: hypothetical protein K940chlam7_01804 [Chlamydiae bacterium]|nr:hypothetical protein [Chlamydiota bacterium]